MVHLPRRKFRFLYSFPLSPPVMKPWSGRKPHADYAFAQIWLTEAYYDKHLSLFSHLYDLEQAAQWSAYVRGRFSFDVG